MDRKRTSNSLKQLNKSESLNLRDEDVGVNVFMTIICRMVQHNICVVAM